MEVLPVGVAIVDAKGGYSLEQDVRRGLGQPLPGGEYGQRLCQYKAWWLDTNEPVQPEQWASARAVQKGETVVGQLMRIERFDGKPAFVS